MQVIVVTVEEAQGHLPDLIARIAAGDHVVIARDGKSVATLGRPPMFPTTPEEVATGDAAYLALVRDVVEGHERNGDPLPPDHPLRRILLRGAA